MTAHFEFISTTKVGDAIITIEEVKLGKQLSTLHLTLWQGKGMLDQAPWVTRSVTKPAILAYATQANLTTFTGLSMPMGFQVLDANTRPAKPDLAALLAQGSDAAWVESIPPAAARGLLKSNLTWRMFVPRAGPFTPGVLDMWLATRNGEPITQAMLPYAVDSFPFDMYHYLVSPEIRAMLLQPPPKAGESKEKEAERKALAKKSQERGNLWFPTVVMNVENKIALPEAGVPWINVRITTKLMDNGRFDMDIMVRNEDGETVTLSHHVALIVSMERNVGSKKGKKPQASL